MQAHTLWFCFSHIQTGGKLQDTYQIKVDHWEYIWIYWPAPLINLTLQSTYTSTLGCGSMLEYPRRHRENIQTPFTIILKKERNWNKIQHILFQFLFFSSTAHIVLEEEHTQAQCICSYENNITVLYCYISDEQMFPTGIHFFFLSFITLCVTLLHSPTHRETHT